MLYLKTWMFLNVRAIPKVSILVDHVVKAKFVAVVFPLRRVMGLFWFFFGCTVPTEQWDGLA